MQERSVRARLATTLTLTGTAWPSRAVSGTADRVAVKVPGVVPTPLKVMVRPGATVSTPGAPPVPAGEKATVIVHVAFFASDAQVVPCSTKPRPETDGLSATVEPKLVTVTVFVELDPWSTEPKLSVA